MSYYLNPIDMSKEEWLMIHGVEVPVDEIRKLEDFSGSDVSVIGVCLIDNGPFRSAGIIYNSIERDEFTDLSDSRSRKYFLCQPKDIFKVCPDVAIQFSRGRLH